MSARTAAFETALTHALEQAHTLETTLAALLGAYGDLLHQRYWPPMDSAPPASVDAAKRGVEQICRMGEESELFLRLSSISMAVVAGERPTANPSSAGSRTAGARHD